MKRAILTPIFVLIASASMLHADLLSVQQTPVETAPGKVIFTNAQYAQFRSYYWYDLTKTVLSNRKAMRSVVLSGDGNSTVLRELEDTNRKIGELIKTGNELLALWEPVPDTEPLAKVYKPLIPQIVKLLEEARVTAPPQDQTSGAKDELKVAHIAQNGVEGVPKEVTDEIVNRAKRNQNGFLVRATVESEVAAYRKVTAFKTETALPAEVRDAIVSQALRKFPTSWVAAAGDIGTESDSWRTIQKWESEGAPGMGKQKTLDVIKAAKARYPQHWSMLVHAVGNHQE